MNLRAWLLASAALLPLAAHAQRLGPPSVGIHPGQSIDNARIGANNGIQGLDGGGAQPAPTMSDRYGNIHVNVFPNTLTSGDPYISPDSIMLGGQASQSSVQLTLRGQPYGYYDTGTLMSLVSTGSSIYSSRAGVNGGFEAGVPAMASYGGFDMVNLYQGIASAEPWLILTGVTYDATHIYPPSGTTFTPSQLAQLRRSMWVMTNSIDTTVSATPAITNGIPPITTYGSTVISWSASSIVVSGWTVPGSGHTASGQVPTAASPQKVSFGAPTAMFGRNLVMQNMPGAFPDSLAHNFVAEEVDMQDFGTVDYGAKFTGWTCQYTAFGISTTSGTNVKPTPDSYCLHLGGGLQDQLIIDELGAANAIRTNAHLFRGGDGPLYGSPAGTKFLSFEHSAYADGTNNLRLVGWTQRDSTSTIGYADQSWHMGYMVDGAQGTMNGTLQSQIVFGGPTNPGGLALCGSGGCGLQVKSGGTVDMPNGLSAEGPATLTGGVVVPFGTPASSTSSCVQGQAQFDAGYLYTCIATNSWQPTPNTTALKKTFLDAGGTPSGTFGASFTTVILPTVTTDVGGNYNTTTGIYTVPVSGTYQCISKVRITDSQGSTVNYGQGVGTSDADSTSFLWYQTNVNRNGSLNITTQHFNAGDSVRLYMYGTGTALLSAELNMILLYPDAA